MIDTSNLCPFCLSQEVEIHKKDEDLPLENHYICSNCFSEFKEYQRRNILENIHKKMLIEYQECSDKKIINAIMANLANLGAFNSKHINNIFETLPIISDKLLSKQFAFIKYLIDIKTQLEMQNAIYTTKFKNRGN